MLEDLTTNQIPEILGEFAKVPIIDLLKIYVNSFSNNENWWKSEFKSLLVKLSVAEKRGTSVKDRLKQEIEEWAVILDDDVKSRLYVVGNDTIIDIFAQISNNEDKSFLTIFEDLKDDLDDSKYDDIDIFFEGLNSYLTILQTPDYLDGIEEKMPFEIQTLMKKNENELTKNEKLKVLIAVWNFPDSFVKLMKKLIREILLVHSEMDYYQRILDYQAEILENEVPDEEEQIGKKLCVPIPKVERSPKDNITSLTLEQTTYLISLLRESRVFLQDKNYQPAINIAMSTKLMTGYNEQNIRDKYDNIDRLDKFVVQDKLKEISKLITSHLE